MSKIEMLRELIKERLTSAAEEIFEVFGRTIVEYEEELCRSKLEIDRQRRLLAMSRKPEIKLDRIAVLPDPQDWSHSLDPEPPRVKEEQEDLEAVEEEEEEEEQLLQGLEEFPFYQTKEGDPQPGTSSEHTQGEADGEDCGLDSQLTSPDCSIIEGLQVGLPSGRTSYSCTTCGIDFVQRGHWARHMRAHKLGKLDVKSYKCEICGKRLTRLDGFQKHLRVHTGEKPYSCGICGKRFSDNSNYKRHMRTHSAEKLHPCSECRKRFDSVEQLTAHMASHHVPLGGGGNDS